MPWPYDIETSTIGCRDIDDSQTLGCCNDGRVCRTDAEVPVPVHKPGDAEPIARRHRLGYQVSCCEITQEADLGVDAQAGREQVVNLGDDEGGDEQRSGIGL